MSVRQVLDTVEALLKDPAEGLAATIASLAESIEGEGAEPWTMDVQLSDLLLEFIPSIHDGSQTVTGTPTLLPQRSGYAFDPGDAIVFDRALFDRVVNEGASGFTVLVAVRAIALAGSDFTLFVYTDPSANGAAYLTLVQGADGAHVRVTGGMAYNINDYEWRDDAGNVTLGAHVIAIRFTRTAAIGSRVQLFVDGVPLTGGSPGAPIGSSNPGVLAGTVATYPTGTVTLGHKAVWGAAPNTPAGAVWGWKAALDDETIAVAMQRALAHYPVEA